MRIDKGEMGLKEELRDFPNSSNTHLHVFACKEEHVNKRTIAIVAGAIVLAASAAWLFAGSQTTGRVSEELLGSVPAGIMATVTSKDGLHVAYVVQKGDKQLVVVDGQPGPEYDRISEGSPVFSRDGKRAAYVAQKGDKQLVVVDGQPGPEYDGIVKGGPTFRPNASLEYLAMRSGRLYRVKQ
jgi:hypothetical protein